MPFFGIGCGKWKFPCACSLANQIHWEYQLHSLYHDLYWRLSVIPNPFERFCRSKYPCDEYPEGSCVQMFPGKDQRRSGNNQVWRAVMSRWGDPLMPILSCCGLPRCVEERVVTCCYPRWWYWHDIKVFQLHFKSFGDTLPPWISQCIICTIMIYYVLYCTCLYNDIMLAWYHECEHIIPCSTIFWKHTRSAKLEAGLV